MFTRSILFVAALVAAPHTALAEIRVGPQPWTVDGSVVAMAASDRTLYLGGNFTTVGPSTGGGIIVDARTGAITSPGPQVAGSVRAVVSDGRGGWFIGGEFDGIQGRRREAVAHVFADGSMDDSWDGRINGVGNFARVWSLERVGDVLFVGGDFDSAGGVACRGLAAVDTRTGSLAYVAPSTNGIVYAMTSQGRTLYIGGGFQRVGADAHYNLASIDVATGAVNDWNPHVYGSVSSLALRAGALYVAGGFNAIDESSRNGLAALDAKSGTVLPWAPEPHGGVRSLAIAGNTVFACGSFDSIGGQARRNLAAVDAKTGLATTWEAPSRYDNFFALFADGAHLFVGSSVRSLGKQGIQVLELDARTGVEWASVVLCGGSVFALSSQGGRLFVGGGFSSAGRIVSRRNLAAFDLDTGEVTPWAPEPDAYVLSISLASGRVIVGGLFSEIAGSARAGLAALDAQTGIALPFAWDVNAPVAQLLSNGSTVYAGGPFTRVGGQERSHLAALDAATGEIEAFAPAIGGSISSLALSQNVLYLGGSFSSAGGSPRDGLAAVDVVGGQVFDWAPASRGVVSTIAIDGSAAYVGGRLESLQGETRYGVGAVDATTAALLPWAPMITRFNDMPVVTGLAIHDGIVFACGDFRAYTDLFRNGFAGFDATTGELRPEIPSTFGIGTSLLLHKDRLYVGGHFESIGNWPCGNVARIDLSQRSVALDRTVRSTDAVAPGGLIELSAISPNPAGKGATIELRLREPARVSFEVYDLRGRLVGRHTDDAARVAGEHAIRLDVGGYAPGLYFVRVKVGEQSLSRKLVVAP